MVVAGSHTLTTRDVSVKTGRGRLVKRHQPAFVKLGVANEQPVGGYVLEREGKSLGDTQTGHRQQCKQRAVGAGPQRTCRPELCRSFNQSIDLSLAEDVWDSTRRCEAENVAWGNLVAVILDLRMPSHSNDGLKPMIALAQ